MHMPFITFPAEELLLPEWTFQPPGLHFLSRRPMLILMSVIHDIYRFFRGP